MLARACILLGTALVLAATAQVAVGARTPPGTLLRGISDSELLLYQGPERRELALRHMRAAGLQMVRLMVDWRYLQKDLAAPANGGLLSALDDTVKRADRHHLDVLITIAHAPEHAEDRPRWRPADPGSWAVNPDALGAIAGALARRYDGTFVTGGARLPRVRFWQAWNEPNLPRYLAPQWQVTGDQPNWVPWAPHRFRAMVGAFARAVKAVHGDNYVIAGAAAPQGESADGAGRMSPVRFWRAVLCLNAPGRAPDRRVPCAAPGFPVDAIAHHPLSVSDPDVPATSGLDISLADLQRLRHILGVARRFGTAPDHKLDLWVTELNWDRRNVDGTALSKRAQLRFVSRAMQRLELEQATAVFWHFLEDPRSSDGSRRPAGLLRSLRGNKRTALADGFFLPLVATRAGPRKLSVWALPRDRPVLLQVRRPAGAWATIRSQTAAFTLPRRLRHAKVLQLRRAVGGPVFLVQQPQGRTLMIRPRSARPLRPARGLPLDPLLGPVEVPANLDPRPGSWPTAPPVPFGLRSFIGVDREPPRARNRIEGTPWNDVLVASSQPDVIVGHGGRDRVVGVQADDIILP